MIGWEPVPPIAGGHEDVEKCTGPNCGALVRRSANAGHGRIDHDRAFHMEDKPLAILAHDLFDALVLLAVSRDDSECRFDHNGDCQQHGYFDFDKTRGCPMVRIRELLDRNGITQEMAENLG